MTGANADPNLVDETSQTGPRLVGAVETLLRYPVKSMRGERLTELPVTPAGAVGDRAWALRDPATGRIASAKTVPRLLELQARYVVEPTVDRRGTAVITLPGGDEVGTDDPSVSAAISEALGRELRLESAALADEKAAIDRATVFGDVPVSRMKPDWTPETMPDYFQLPRDLSVLRTTANHHDGCLGVYGSVVRPGVVRVGDSVSVL
jgi:uncharacterized protein YcbX